MKVINKTHKVIRESELISYNRCAFVDFIFLKTISLSSLYIIFQW